jgi:hypothetical protein
MRRVTTRQNMRRVTTRQNMRRVTTRQNMRRVGTLELGAVTARQNTIKTCACKFA